MPENQNSRDPSFSLAVHQRIDERCQRFEKAWQDGPQPQMKDYLQGATGPVAQLLFRELIRLDIEYRRGKCGSVASSDYLPHYPHYATVIEQEIARQVAPPRGDTVAPDAATGVLLPTVAVPGYEIVGSLGVGGMGIVYRAHQVRAKRQVALKVVRSGSDADPEELARFRGEAEAAARLLHPNIAQIYEVGEQGGMPYFSMELCEAGGLDAYLRRGPLTPDDAARLIETLARAMQHAHENGIVHRDLKPANILLSPASGARGKGEEDGDRSPLSSLTPKVGDFGLARKLESAGQTQTGAIMGTPSYMAPEQAAGKNKEVGPAADVYALGAILYECLTGHPPFKAATAFDTILLVLNAEPIPPSRLESKVPRDLETIALKCLEKASSRRYVNAADLAEDLRAFQNKEPIGARRIGRLERAMKWVRRRPARAALVGLGCVTICLLLLLGILSWQTTHEKKQNELQCQEEEQSALHLKRLQPYQAQTGSGRRPVATRPESGSEIA